MATAQNSQIALPQLSRAVADWVQSTRELTQADHVHWCDGSEGEYEFLQRQLASKGELHALNGETFPNCFLARSNPSDVARVEHLTFVCTRNREDAGPRAIARTPVLTITGWIPPTRMPRCASCSRAA